MSVIPDLDDVFSLKGMFKIAVAATTAFTGAMLLEPFILTLFHFMPGGVALVAAAKPFIASNPLVLGLDSLFDQAATMLGGGQAAMASSMGAGIDPVSGGMVVNL